MSCTAKTVARIRNANAPTMPYWSAFFCWRFGSGSTSTARTRALSALSAASSSTRSPIVMRSAPSIEKGMGGRMVPQFRAIVTVMIGKTLSHYRVVEQIGAGGMGVVHRARDERLGRDVALKVLPPGALSDDAARERFRREALALSQLNHPHIATIYDLGRQEGVDFLVMEYIPGQTVAQKIAEGALSEAEAASIGCQITEALEEAHDQGVVHGDLKSENVIVTPKGWAKVLDFGLATLRGPMLERADTAEYTGENVVSGTLPYMAPEQLLTGQSDSRSDLYALGV